MCDIVLAPPATTGAGTMLFGKNSDRQPNEAQLVELLPRASHERGAMVKTTYLTIPQATHTHAVVLCRPFWIWGAEMGANEYGVVIGNEGVHARTPAPQAPALIGMDLIRLALERATTAEQAVDVITNLLEKHGQGGNCGHQSPSYYHNSFMIADAYDAFVLETIGREWLLERVVGVRAISNGYSIDGDISRSSGGLNTLLRSYGCEPVGRVDYASVIADPTRSHISSAGARRARAQSLLAAAVGGVTSADLMTVLRDHDIDGEHAWRPNLDTPFSLCIHAGLRAKNAHTTGALVSEIGGIASLHWVTATAAPCLSIFKPVFTDVPLPPYGPSPTDRFDANTLWWSHEAWHRAALMGDFHSVLTAIRSERDELEAEFRRRASEVMNGGDAADRERVIVECWRDALATERRWQSRVRSFPLQPDGPFTREWLRLNELAGCPLPDSSAHAVKGDAPA